MSSSIGVFAFLLVIGLGASVRMSEHSKSKLDKVSSGGVVQGKMIISCDLDRLGIVLTMLGWGDMNEELRGASPVTPASIPFSWPHKKKNNKTVYFFTDVKLRNAAVAAINARTGGMKFDRDETGATVMRFAYTRAVETFVTKLLAHILNPRDGNYAVELLNNIQTRAKAEGEQGRRRRWKLWHSFAEGEQGRRRRWKFWHSFAEGDGCRDCKVKYTGGSGFRSSMEFKPEGWVRVRCMRLKGGEEAVDDGEQGYDDEEQVDDSEGEAPDLQNETVIDSRNVIGST